VTVKDSAKAIRGCVVAARGVGHSAVDAMGLGGSWQRQRRSCLRSIDEGGTGSACGHGLSRCPNGSNFLPNKALRSGFRFSQYPIGARCGRSRASAHNGAGARARRRDLQTYSVGGRNERNLHMVKTVCDLLR
jgi:hypothetical protein